VNQVRPGGGFSPPDNHFFRVPEGVKLFLPDRQYPAWLPFTLRDKYGINTDEIRIDPVFIP